MTPSRKAKAVEVDPSASFLPATTISLFADRLSALSTCLPPSARPIPRARRRRLILYVLYISPTSLPIYTAPLSSRALTSICHDSQLEGLNQTNFLKNAPTLTMKLEWENEDPIIMTIKPKIFK